MVFRAEVDVVSLMKIFESDPSWKWYIGWSLGTTDQINELIKEKLGEVGSFVVDNGVENFQLIGVELIQTACFVP